MTVLHTARLELRPWRADDLAPFAALNNDPEVMQFMPACLSRAESDALAARAAVMLAERGWGLWALATEPQQEFLGYVGLAEPSFAAAFTPCTEILWRLKRTAWGHGYAAEAARACLRYAFGTLALAEVVAFTVPANLRSRALMERLGMWRDHGGDFEHPRLPPGHPLRPHLLYRFARDAWVTAEASRAGPAGG
jgi:RimJ/RimL family protein N-acetyltransferase